MYRPDQVNDKLGLWILKVQNVEQFIKLAREIIKEI